jgi:rare lipoprotein A
VPSSYHWTRLALVLGLIALMAGCANSSKRDRDSGGGSTSAPSSGRYQGKDKDWGPEQEIDMSHVPDAVPRYELRTIAGNKNPYTVLGKTYVLMDDERAYKERGIASWYGYKFNGERTSNGESYDMFAMTGAHKTLPIPSYVRVTNLDNKKSVIVRINDRGPFHDDRIVDLSYAAAQRLGITRMGTGRVELEVIVPEGDPRPPLLAKKSRVPKSRAADTGAREAGIVSNAEVGALADTAAAAQAGALPAGTYLQIAAFGQEKSAKQFASAVGAKLDYPVVISAVKSPQRLYRVRVGPLSDAQTLQTAREQLQKIDISQAHVVYQ